MNVIRFRLPMPWKMEVIGGDAISMTRVHSISASFDAPAEAITLPDVDVGFTRTDTDLAHLSLSGQSAADRWTFPVTIGASYRF